MQSKIPGPKFWQNGPVSNLADYFLGLSRQYGDLVKLPGLKAAYLVNDPTFIKKIALRNASNYDKKMLPYRRVQAIIGDGLVTKEGHAWHRQRKCLQSLFQPHQFEQFTDRILAQIATTSQRWQQYAQRNQPIEIESEMMDLVLRITGDILFNTELSEQCPHILKKTNRCNDYSQRAIMLWRYTPTWQNLRFQFAQLGLNQQMKRLMRQHESRIQAQDDVIDRLTKLAAESQHANRELIDNLKTFLLTGHETTACALAWSWLSLAEHPHYYDQLQTECLQQLAGRPACKSDLTKLPFTQQVFAESMRLYPPLWSIARRAKQADQFDQFRIPKKAWLFISPFALHRHANHWQKPDEFFPEHFSAEAVSQRERFSYIPFGIGKRTCIASSFAEYQAHLILASLGQQFRLTRCDNDRVETKSLVSLRMASKVKMKVESLACYSTA